MHSQQLVMFGTMIRKRSVKCLYSIIKDEITFTPTFQKALDERLLKKEKDEFLRLQISAGEGCQGFTYKFKFDKELTNDDYVSFFGSDRVKFAVNTQQLRLIRGSTLNFVSEMMREVFQVKQNPNAEISCSCKTSFSPKDFLL